MKGKGKSARNAATAKPRSGQGPSGGRMGVAASGVEAVADRRGGVDESEGSTDQQASPEQASPTEAVATQTSASTVTPAAPAQPANGASGAAAGGGSGAASAPVNGSGSGTNAASQAQSTPQTTARVEQDGAVFYDEQETWKHEFQKNRHDEIELHDGSVVTVGERYDQHGYYVEDGKKKPHATGAYYMSAGLDGIQSVEEDPKSPGRYVVSDRHGGMAVYDAMRDRAADLSGEKEKTAAQMGAVMAGTRRQLERDPSSLAGQYRDAYDSYMADPTQANNVRATDAYYAWAKSEGRPEEIGYADNGLTTDLGNYKANAEAEAAAAQQAQADQQAAAAEQASEALAGAQARDSGLNADHGKLLSFSSVNRVEQESLSEEDRRMVPTADPSFVMAASHEEVGRDMGMARAMGMKSHAVLGEPGTGKNFLIEQLSAAEGRPHLEIDVDETTEVSELFGASTMKDGQIAFAEGKVTHALKNGHRVVLNEANTAPVEVMTQFHNIVGSGNSTESRFITIKSPEGESTRIPVHEDSEIVFTYNPEGTGREGGLGRALADRVEHFHMRKPTIEEGAGVVASQANKFLSKAGRSEISTDEAKKCMGFFDDLRSAYRDNQPGMVKEPDTRWLHRFSAFRSMGDRQMAIRRTEEFLDHSSAGEGEREQMRQSISDMYSRWFGRG